uniref:Uncharacterized protein n=1 Tax=Rhizophora mucronata TaxID=61149 RepID=A0A2P2J803_RHIMU
MTKTRKHPQKFLILFNHKNFIFQQKEIGKQIPLIPIRK